MRWVRALDRKGGQSISAKPSHAFTEMVVFRPLPLLANLFLFSIFSKSLVKSDFEATSHDGPRD